MIMMVDGIKMVMMVDGTNMIMMVDGIKMVMMVTKITAIAHNSVKKGHRSQKICIQANFEVLN